MQILIDTTVDGEQERHYAAAMLAASCGYSLVKTEVAPAESPINGEPAPIVLKDDEPAPTPAGFVRISPTPSTEILVPQAAAFPSPPAIPAPPGPAPAPEVDSAGVAFDPNIHSSSRSKTIDGRWKARRGTKVTAGTTPTPPPLPSAPTVAVTAANVIPPPPTVFLPADDNDVEVEDDTGESAGVPASDGPGAIDFPTFISKVTAGMSSGTVTQARIAEVMKQFSIDSLFSLNTKPDLVPRVAAVFGFV